MPASEVAVRRAAAAGPGGNAAALHGLGLSLAPPAPRARWQRLGTCRPGPAALGTPCPVLVACSASAARCPTGSPALRGLQRTTFGAESERQLPFGWGGVPTRLLGEVPGPLGGSQAAGSDGSCSLWQEGPRRPPDTRPGWLQRTEPDRNLPLLGEPWTVRPPETPRSPAKLNCPALGAPGPARAPGAGCGWLVMGDREKTWLGRVRFCLRV